MQLKKFCSCSVIAILASVVAVQAQTHDREPQAEESGKGGEKDKADQQRRGSGEQGKPSGKAAQEEGKGRAGKADESRGSPKAAGEGKDTPRDGERVAQAERGTGGSAKGRVKIAVRPEQKTKLHDIITRETQVRHYHRSDVHFNLQVGVRVPDDVVFYDAPTDIIDIDPDFRGYKIIIVDDEILVIDPETREVVDVIDI